MTLKIDISRIRQFSIILLFLFCALANQLKGKPIQYNLNIDLYGHQLSFSISNSELIQQDGCYSESNLKSSITSLIDNTAIDSLISQMNQYSQMLSMDDMAYLLMLNKVTSHLMKNENINYQLLFKYAILQKRGFDVFIGYSESSITLYGSTNFLIDNCLFIERGNKKYYDLSFNQKTSPQIERLFSIPSVGKRLPIVMNMIVPPAYNAKMRKKVFPFEYDGYVYFLRANINESLVEYYNELPTININTLYLNYGVSDNVNASLIKDMKLIVSSMSKTDGVNFLLKFVQEAFEYKKDEEVYGAEKFSFPEETLLSKYSDCEDKAMLFATLVNKVMGIKTVALFYKDAAHINVAIENWNKKSKGNFSFRNQDYIVCEPAGKNFRIGESANFVASANLIDW